MATIASQPNSLSEETRTVEVIWTTGASVRRVDSTRGDFWEELSVDPSHVDLSRLNGGAPLLDTHNNDSIDNVLGVVERAWMDSKAQEGRAIVRFARDEAGQRAMDKVKDGIIKSVSIGYRINEFEKQKEERDGVPVYRAVDYSVLEISLVPVPADAGAKLRKEEKEMIMDNPDLTIQERKIDVQVSTPDNTQEMIQRAVEQERLRISGIQTRGAKAGISSEEIAKAISDGLSIEQASVRFLDAIATRSEENPVVSRIGIVVDETEKTRSAMESVLLHRSNPDKNKLESGNPYASFRLFEMARSCVEKTGFRGAYSPQEIAKRALHSTSDFPYILENVAGKTLRQGYNDAPQTWRPLVSVTSVPDFKQVTRVQLGDMTGLNQVSEGGEYKYGTFGEAREQYSILKYGQIVAITREAIINDDLSAFTRIPMMMGRAVADKESEIVWGRITGNANMSDGNALFSVAHANTVTGAISIASLGEARKAMRLQKSLGGRLMNISPSYIVVPAALEVLAQQYLTSTYVPNSATNINIFANSFNLIVEPRLDAISTTQWYMFASPSAIDTIEVAYLQGNTAPYTERREGFEVDGIELKIRMEMGAKEIDWRGMVRSSGV